MRGVRIKYLESLKDKVIKTKGNNKNFGSILEQYPVVQIEESEKNGKYGNGFWKSVGISIRLWGKIWWKFWKRLGIKSFAKRKNK